MVLQSNFLRYPILLLNGIIVSFYLFPITFTFLPGVNTKMILAALGLIFLGKYMASGRTGKIDKSFFTLSVFACVFSFFCLASTIINETSDLSYASYIVSMWVWIGGAYGCVNILKFRHKDVTISLLIDYIIAVCVFQCISAIMIDNIAWFRRFINSYVDQGQAFMEEVNRLYGIGASLDTAGARFAVTLVLLVYSFSTQKFSQLKTAWYILAFVVIIIIGNMIARTTSVGAVSAICLYFFLLIRKRWEDKTQLKKAAKWLFVVLILAIPITVNLYNSDAVFHKNIRFGFEGFFSLVETGQWQTGSNDKLKTMVVRPDNTKTWLIGDGYFDNPKITDPYFTGEITQGNFYKKTDIGYLRFIFYCGVLGLLAFSLFIIKAGQICMEKFPRYKLMFFVIILLNFIIWIKVATDQFYIFAILLCASPDISPKEEDEEQEDEEASPQTRQLPSTTSPI